MPAIHPSNLPAISINNIDFLDQTNKALMQRTNITVKVLDLHQALKCPVRNLKNNASSCLYKGMPHYTAQIPTNISNNGDYDTSKTYICFPSRLIGLSSSIYDSVKQEASTNLNLPINSFINMMQEDEKLSKERAFINSVLIESIRDIQEKSFQVLPKSTANSSTGLSLF